MSGSRATTLADRQAFQDIDQVGIARPITKWAAEPPNAAQIPFYLGRAYAEANSGRKGAVHLTIPVDLFTGKTDAPSVAADAGGRDAADAGLARDRARDGAARSRQSVRW